ncbi:hypothetical protein CBP21_09490 [Fischerella thermalis WC246]|nr:hypothetical protein CBP18_11595 [Fischerella thermalis WC119]PLZ10186.1 hypothetical protein CBP17_11500 [Fischerella thermalis WC114]PLZ10328.1 hypothetical protein CBP19_14805 [Fischerella thermalis WC1110]PLZ18128.1 hypothetical protein CBP29_20315 [Fischerella thermalis WC341]PLZ18472.1 hypothetical protein CBP30_16885 [Fischerella thermalis WC157]PLZ45995.1 hypothetical protein CBP26_00675 [Fischerella thermalis WC538]PLZ53981.1 hypothetical protein CBP13_07435 [Fischerella thermalis
MVVDCCLLVVSSFLSFVIGHLFSINSPHTPPYGKPLARLHTPHTPPYGKPLARLHTPHTPPP